MADYKKLYHKMWSAATDAEIPLTQAERLIRAAQQECEELYTEADDTPIELAGREPDE